MKPTISNILFTTDLSTNSTYAMRHAASLAAATGAKLHVLHVAVPLSDDAKATIRMFMQDLDARKDALTTRHSHFEAELAEHQEKFWAALPKEDQGLRDHVASVEVIDGHPAEVILRRSDELGCDLIILGAHDHGYSLTFLGSVAKRVLRRTTIPTLVIPYREED